MTSSRRLAREPNFTAGIGEILNVTGQADRAIGEIGITIS
jgi:hypothetical protein